MTANHSRTTPKRSPCDLTRTPWKRPQRLLPPARPGGRPREVNLREIRNGISSITRGGGSWRMMPKDLPPWGTCSDSCRTWRHDGTWAQVHDALRTQIRHRAETKKSPSLGIIDRQSVRTTEQGGPRGKDPHEEVNGRERHVVVDTLGLVVAAVEHSAGIPDRDGAELVLKQLVGRSPRLQKILAEGISDGDIAAWARRIGGRIVEPVVRPADEPEQEEETFQVLKWRWIVERTFAWPGRYRRWSKDDERTGASRASWISLALIHLMLRRLDPA